MVCAPSCPQVQASARAVAQRLLLQVFERDTALVSAAIFELSNLATQVHKQFKHRRRSDKQGRTLNENAPLAEDIIESAANQRYPNPAGQICTELWKQAYQSLTSRSGKEGAALFVTAVAQLASFAMPRLEHHLLPTREQSKH